MVADQDKYQAGTKDDEEETLVATTAYSSGAEMVGLSLDELKSARGQENLRHLQVVLTRCNELAQDRDRALDKLEHSLAKANEYHRLFDVAHERLRMARLLLTQSSTGTRLRSLAQIIGSMLAGLSPWTHDSLLDANGASRAPFLPIVLAALGVGLVVVPMFIMKGQPDVIPEINPPDEESDQEQENV